MAIKLKQGKTYNSPFNGDISTAYANIKYSGGYHIFDKQASFDLFIYASEADRLAERNPVKNERFSISGEDFDTYFNVAISMYSATANDSITEAVAKIVYTYLLTKTQEDPENEGQQIPLIIGSINMADWESDE